MFVRLDNGDGLCESCARRREPCVDCGRTMRVYGRIDAGPLCTVCYRKHPSSRRHCVQCGTHERLHHFGLCAGCAAPRQLHAALANHSGDLRPELEPVFSALADYKASSLLLWLSHEQPKQILRTLAEGTGPVTHATLDAMPELRAVTYLRAALVHTDVLPARDEQLASLQRWLSPFLQRVEDSQERALISRFATWVHLRRLRSRARRRPITHGQCQTVRHDIYAAVALQRWLRQHGSSLSTCDQAQIDDWLAQAGRKHTQARSFLTWSAARGHIPTVHVPPRGTSRGAEQLAEEDERWEISKRLLHDTELALTDRVAGCLVVLYGQPVSRIARLTTDKILTGAGGVQLQLGSRPVEIPEPLGSLLLELTRSRQAFAVLGQNEQGPWLFPGGRAGQAMTASHLTVRLNRLGIRARASRNTALLDLAAQIPASVLSDVLGISITCAVAWSHDAGNTRLGYAADVARRGP
ncbi:hypothetical protein [Streptomyces sp. CC210A]|uniref:hypothetical protein n=1 Tax=Streptomyces sp. CC210A TaxID=2898184 RepID=UPI001F1FD630|nr:hypothetical protein [Streptomyces sp. CC210A]